ncbi:MAG TPA: dipeptide epimerase [Cyclobacteriaceae bacterium]|jgi:L-alanine-DL-glutamate epimerase-like enolase superfamily enzyme|nr:dipeptide epimerase [Cytophagales bacterium]HMR56216.1 dipeptide epimerase [Cyclobacteriaceae bacterium]HRE65643.1 dipeptide epimerase [Cyclobacteriaceae bacterium]HRF34745.1 dipeptide epimerase [Cyclobacteriaceae bacterium]
MKIKDIKVWSANLVNTKPYTIAFKTVDEVLNAFVEITLDNGVTGIGAGNPSEYVTGESFEQCTQALQEKNIQFLIGRDIREINQLTFEVWQKLPKNPAARAALDIALYDAFTKHLGIPLVKFLGQKIHSLPTSNTIGIKNVEETLKEAKEYGERGFTVLKVKLGKDLEEDIERMVKLREVFGKKFVIRIDANQGYNIAQTIEFYTRTKQLDIELIEQPLKAKAVEEMRQLPEEIRKVIAADESLLTPVNALQIVRPPHAAGIFNIKLMKCGGVSQALKIADIAQHSGIELFWGCNDESIVSITAALHTAFASSNTKYIDLDGSLDLAKDEVTGGFILKDGVMYCSDKPGLGVERV